MKSIFLSKTAWLGFLMAIVPQVIELFTRFQAELSPVWASVIGIAIIALRMVTKDPVSLTGK